MSRQTLVNYLLITYYSIDNVILSSSVSPQL